MGLRRNRHEELRRFIMRQRLVAIGDDYWIEDDNGARVIKVNGKVALVRDTWELEDLDGSRVARIRERKLSVRDAITIDADGREATCRSWTDVRPEPVGQRRRCLPWGTPSLNCSTCRLICGRSPGRGRSYEDASQDPSGRHRPICTIRLPVGRPVSLTGPRSACAHRRERHLARGNGC